ncbi:hypothetical protein [Nocardia fluminea]|uniref:hypothetical protein n=1 Tax=Nocardia fluminea TaxID=134984 RepID=UPI00364A6F5D
MTELTAPIQLVVDTEKLLDQIGWRTEGYDHEGDPYEHTAPANLRTDLATQVARILATDLREDMRAVVRETVTKVAGEQVAEVVNEVFAAGFRKTNTYGEPIGETITVREMVADQIRVQLERKVGEDGRKPDGYRGNSISYVEYIARTAAKEALRGELGIATTEAVDEVKNRVKALVADQLGAQIAKAVTR